VSELAREVSLNRGQEQARDQIYAWMKSDAKAISLSGPAGTGKTFMTRFLMPELERKFSKIKLTATTGKAALRLAELTRQGTTTLHKALYHPPDDEANKTKEKLVFEQLNVPESGLLLVVDEASMVTPDVWADIQKWTDNFGVRVLFIGDGFQLPPVIDANAKEQDFNIFSLVQGPRLTQVMRNGDVILDAATALRTEGRLVRADLGAYRWRRAKLSDVLGEWLQAPDDHAVITWRNKVRMVGNRVIRKAKSLESGFPTAGEPLLIRRNGRGFLNGQIVTVVDESSAGPLLGTIRATWVRVQFDDGSQRTLFASCQGREEPMDGIFPRLSDEEWKEYLKERRKFEYAFARRQGWDGEGRLPRMDPLPVTWGYCLTAHAGQGSEWARVTVYLDEWDTSSKPFMKPSVLPDGTFVPFWTRWTYTALTRAKKRVDIVIGAG
jgi:AAA domain-containing protein